jgi:glutathione S-transferase
LTFPVDARALVRLQLDHVSRNVVPAFYRYLQAQGPDVQTEFGKEFTASLDALVVLFERAEREIVNTGGAAGEGEVKALKLGLGLWVEGGDLGMTDAMVGPCTWYSLHPVNSADRCLVS